MDDDLEALNAELAQAKARRDELEKELQALQSAALDPLLAAERAAKIGKTQTAFDKAKAAADKIERRIRKTERAREKGAAFADRWRYHFVHQQGCYARDEGDHYKIFNLHHITDRHVALKDRSTFLEWHAEMEDRGWKHDEMTYSCDPTPPGVLNLLKRDGWVKPNLSATTYDWRIKALELSISNGKAENLEYLQRMFAWKILHPGDYRLPAVLVHGEGGAGRGLMFYRLPATIFGEQNCALIMARDVTGTFQSKIAGKLVVGINESVAEKTAAEAIRNWLFSEKAWINEKFIKPYEVSHFAMVAFLSNEATGGVTLRGDHSDRRYSVFKVDHRLEYWLQRLAPEHLGREITYEEAVRIIDEADDKHDMTRSVWRNREKLADWLGVLVTKYGHLPRPEALHGEDYESLLLAQERPCTSLWKDVFLDPTFDAVERTLLYRGMEAYTAPRYRTTRNKFYEETRDWLRKNAPHIEERRVYWKPNKNLYAFVDTTRAEPGKRNTNRLYAPDGLWVRELP